MSHDANRTAQNIKAFSKGLATSFWIPFIFWQFCLNCRRTQPGLLLTSCSPWSLSWNGNLTEHLRHKKVRQRYKCLHPARFVSESFSQLFWLCDGEIFILIRRSSECKFDDAQTSQTSRQSLMIYTSRPTRSPFLNPAALQSHMTRIYCLATVAHSHFHILPSCSHHLLHISDFRQIFDCVFSPCGTQSVAGVVLQLRKAVQSPEWFSIFTEWYALIGLNSEPECFTQLHGDTEWLHTWARVNVIATAWIFLRCNSRFKLQDDKSASANGRLV